MGIANSIVFFSAETSLGIGVLHTSTGYNIRITVTVHIHHCHLILRTAACIVKGNSQSSALVHLALALGNQRNGCRTGSLQAITLQTSHIHLIIQRIGNDHILFCQSGRTGFSSCQVDFLTLSNPAVGDIWSVPIGVKGRVNGSILAFSFSGSLSRASSMGLP